MFEDDPSVLYVSLHRYGGGFYPGFSGAPSETGTAPARGKPVTSGRACRRGRVESPQYGDAEYVAL